VHCQQGVSRSPSIVIAYLIRNHGMSYESALAFVRRKRACVKPNPGFAQALVEWVSEKSRMTLETLQHVAKRLKPIW
jgi:protein-tyrosine phosphatase